MSVDQLAAAGHACGAARSLAFGSPDDGVWGACWLSLPADGGRRWGPSGGPHRLAVGAGPELAIVEVSVSEGDPDEPWRVTGDGVELTLTPASGPPPTPASAATSPGLDQVCQVEGRLAAGGTPRSVACSGWRASGGPLEPAGRVESFRQVAAWFGPADGLALLAVRPRSAKGQDQDVLTAVVLDAERPLPVAEPRLSTTYDAAGRPLRAGLELWLGAATRPDGVVEEEQHSRRAAGEAVGSAAVWTAGPLELQAQLFRWHSAGRDGAGVYLSGVLR